MKHILVEELEVGDIFYFDDSYRVVLPGTRIKANGVRRVPNKCIMAPTPNKNDSTAIGIGTVSWLAEYFYVKLLVRDGKEV